MRKAVSLARTYMNLFNENPQDYHNNTLILGDMVLDSFQVQRWQKLNEVEVTFKDGTYLDIQFGEDRTIKSMKVME